jgi:hypothetical protein
MTKINTLFQAPATIIKVETMADRTFRLKVDTSIELSHEASAMLMQLTHTEGVFAFGLSEIEPDHLEAPEYAKIEKDDKSPSQRLRSVLYVAYSQQKQKFYPDFESYYRAKMEQIINHYKNNL